jgi:hypothetical protein
MPKEQKNKLNLVKSICSCVLAAALLIIGYIIIVF